LGEGSKKSSRLESEKKLMTFLQQKLFLESLKFYSQMANSVRDAFGNDHVRKALDALLVDTLANTDLGRLSLCVHLGEGTFQHGHSDGQALSNKRIKTFKRQVSNISPFYSLSELDSS
jgi:hypothetical protein